MIYLQPVLFSCWLYCSSGWPSHPHKYPVFPEFAQSLAWKISQERKSHSSTSIATYPYLPQTQAPYFSHHFLKSPITMLASVRREKSCIWGSFWEVILLQCGNTMGNVGFVTENMVHVLPELIHSYPLGRAARAAEKQQCESSQDSEVIIHCH